MRIGLCPRIARALLITDPLIVIATIILGSVDIVVSFLRDGERKQHAVARSGRRC